MWDWQGGWESLLVGVVRTGVLARVRGRVTRVRGRVTGRDVEVLWTDGLGREWEVMVRGQV